MDNLSIHLRSFNEKVKVMNQTQSKSMTLTNSEARNIHADMFALLTHLAELSDKLNSSSEESGVTTISMDGGGFK